LGARAVVGKAPHPPAYGSGEWAVLPEGHPAKVSGLVVVAEAWQRADDDLEADLARSLADAALAAKEAGDAAYAEQMEAHRKRWSSLGSTSGRSP
jgi:hypothetical protein